MNSPLKSSLEQYLDTLHRYLRLVPSQWRDEQIAEVRQHLTAHTDELTLEGMTPTAAEEEAIRCFGSATQTARSLMLAWWRQLLPLDKAILRPAGMAMVAFLTIGTTVFLWAMPLSHLLTVQKPWYLLGLRFPVAAEIINWLLLLLLGSVVGVWGGRRAVVGTFWGGVTGMVLFRIIGHIQFAFQMQDPKFRQMVEDAMARAARHDPSVSVIPVYSMLLQEAVYLVVFCLGAYLGKRKQRRQRVII